MKIRWKPVLVFIFVGLIIWLDTHDFGTMLIFTASVLYFSSLREEN